MGIMCATQSWPDIAFYVFLSLSFSLAGSILSKLWQACSGKARTKVGTTWAPISCAPHQKVPRSVCKSFSRIRAAYTSGKLTRISLYGDF